MGTCQRRQGRPWDGGTMKCTALFYTLLSSMKVKRIIRLYQKLEALWKVCGCQRCSSTRGQSSQVINVCKLAPWAWCCRVFPCVFSLKSSQNCPKLAVMKSCSPQYLPVRVCFPAVTHFLPSGTVGSPDKWKPFEDHWPANDSSSSSSSSRSQ